MRVLTQSWGRVSAAAVPRAHTSLTSARRAAYVVSLGNISHRQEALLRRVAQAVLLAPFLLRAPLLVRAAWPVSIRAVAVRRPALDAWRGPIYPPQGLLLRRVALLVLLAPSLFQAR